MEITKDLLERVFPNAPLKEVAYEIRFAPRLRVQRDLADFQGQIVSDYPSYVNEAILIDNDQVQGWRFTSDDRGRTVRVTERSFGFITSRYVSFEKYISELLRLQKTFTETFDIQSVSRAGLRYINNIVFKLREGGAPLLTHVNPVIDVSRVAVGEITRFACDIQLKKPAGLLTIRTGLVDLPHGVPQNLSGQGVYILDLDFHTEGTLPLPTHELLAGFHGEIQAEFLAHLKESYLPIMETSK